MFFKKHGKFTTSDVAICYVVHPVIMCSQYKQIHIGVFMRTNIVIDDDLMASAFKSTGLKTKRDVVEQGLILLIKRNQQQGIRNLRGKVKWEGDLDEMRGRK